MMEQRAPRVFISYSHDSAEHAARVLQLTNKLRRDGVDALIDQYVTSPPEGWPLWMERHIREDDFVVMVCTSTYYRRVANQEKPGTGLGVRWEGSLIYNAIYKAEGDLSRFVPILLSGGRFADIPDRLVGGTHYNFDTPTGYEGLLRRIFNRPEADMPTVPQCPAQWTTHPSHEPPPSLSRQAFAKRDCKTWHWSDDPGSIPTPAAHVLDSTRRLVP